MLAAWERAQVVKKVSEKRRRKAKEKREKSKRKAQMLK
jgi:hypothetical protein